MPRFRHSVLITTAFLGACAEDPPTCVEVIADLETWETERILALHDGYALIGGKSIALYDGDAKLRWKNDHALHLLDFALIDGDLVAVTTGDGVHVRRWSLEGDMLADDVVGAGIEARAAIIASDGIIYLHGADGDHGVWTSVGADGESEVHIDDGWRRGDGFSTHDGDLIVVGSSTTAHDISVRRLSPDGTEQWGYYPQHEGESEVAGLYPDGAGGAYAWLASPGSEDDGALGDESIAHLEPDGAVSWTVAVEGGSMQREIAAADTRVVSVRRTPQASSSDILVLDASSGETLCATTIATDPSGLFDALVHDDVVSVINHDGWMRARLLE